MQSSFTPVRSVAASAATASGSAIDALFANASNISATRIPTAASTLLQPLIDAVWPDTDEPLARLRRSIASWLSGGPFPELGPCHAVLTSAGHFLRLEPSLSPVRLSPASPSLKLKLLLLSPESRGIFVVCAQDGREVVMLDELALRGAAGEVCGISGGQSAPQLLPSPWELTSAMMSAGQSSAPQLVLHCPDKDGPRTAAGSDGNGLTATPSIMTSSSMPLASAACSSALMSVFSLCPDASDQLDSHAGILPQPVLTAVTAAWPGAGALARLKRRAALALAAAHDGPEGPYSMLASALGDVLHRHEPDAVAELRHPVTKTLRVKQLLHEGSAGEAPLQSMSSVSSVSSLPSLSSMPSMPSMGPGSPGSVASVAGALGANGVEGAGFLRVVKGKYDIVVVLDLAGLVQAHGQSGPGAAAVQPPPAAVPSSTLLQTSLSVGGASAASSSSMHTSSTPFLLTRSASDLTASGELGQTLQGPMAQCMGLQTADSGGASSAAMPYGVEGVAELALRAFPGSSPAAQLRRAIVVHLAGLPRRSQQWTHLGIFVASSQAHLWLNPGHRWPKLKAFVMHPDSRGAFLDMQLPGPGAAAGLVALDPAALRRAAAAGLATAIAAAWPGHAPLERIRRAAAFTLAFAVRGPAGPYTMLGSALGTAIRKRDKEAFDALAGMGKLSELLDDTAVGAGGGGSSGAGGGAGGGGSVWEMANGVAVAAAAAAVAGPVADSLISASSGDDADALAALAGAGAGAAAGSANGGGYIVSFKKDQDGYMRLRLEALLQDWPREDPSEAGGSSGRLNVVASSSDGSCAGAELTGYVVPPSTGGFTVNVAPAFQGTLPAAASLPLMPLAVPCGSVHTGPHAPVVDVGSPPLEQELLRRFLAPPGVPSGSELATIAAAKRCIARLLAWAPPPHQLTFAKLGAQVPKLLGGARIGRNLRLVCLEEPEVFAVQSQSPTVHVVRLVCPRLLQLAHEQSERKNQSAQLPSQQHPQQPQQQQVVQMFVQHPGTVQHQLTSIIQLQNHNQHSHNSLGAQLQLQQVQQPASRSTALVHPGTPAHSLSQLRLQQTASQRLLLQPQLHQAEQEVELQQHHVQVQMIGAAELGRTAAAGHVGWPAGWQQQLQQQLQQQTPQRQQSATQEQQLLLLQQQQQQQHIVIPTLKHQHSLGTGAAGGAHQRLYNDRLSMTGAAPLSALSTVSSGGLDGYGSHPIDVGPVSWHGGNAVNAGGSITQQQHVAAASARPGVGGIAQRLQDFTSSALVAEQALQPQGSAGSVAMLPATALHVLADPYSPDFLAVLQHCHACPQIGLAIQVYGGRPALVSLYAPSAPVAVAAADGPPGSLPGTWSPAVYVLDCTARSAGEGPEAVVGTLLASLRGLLEEPGVAKVVHGCEQVRPLEVAAGAAIAPLLDTRVLLEAISTMLPPLPPPPSIAAVAAAAAADPLPSGGYSSPEAAAMAQLAAHIGGLRAVLQSVELWADRPELVTVLAGLHFAAHRAELWAAAGRDSTWLSRPLTESQVAVAAQAVHHLPELWAALCEAVPWLAAHAALRLMQHLSALLLDMRLSRIVLAPLDICENPNTHSRASGKTKNTAA